MGFFRSGFAWSSAPHEIRLHRVSRHRQREAADVMRRAATTTEEAPARVRRFSLLELIACAEAETKHRKQVYPLQVSKGLMRRAMADREIALMDAIASYLRKQAGVEGWGV